MNLSTVVLAALVWWEHLEVWNPEKAENYIQS